MKGSQTLGASLLALALSTLVACGGGGGGGGGGDTPSGSGASGGQGGGASSAAASSSSSTYSGDDTIAGIPPERLDAARFLAQASFGANDETLDDVTRNGASNWLDRQFAMAPVSHLDYVDAIAATRPSGAGLLQKDFFESFWTQAAAGQDQLRQRVAFALSEIMVVSFQGVLTRDVRGVSSYYDVLSRDAFGNFRTLLEDVTLHPAMGQYLTWLGNRKEDGKGRMPDENYARESMQLFTIGLYQLNPDGTQVLSNGKPMETYTNADVTGLAKVFTGWGWGGPDTTDNRWVGALSAQDPNRAAMPMQPYAKYHSVSAKSFLGTTIPAQSTPDPVGDLKIALDTLFNHPNVGPFIGRQLIQRLVTSNPSPAYVGRVAAAFANNGQGVRGDMKAVIRAVLLDPEARSATLAGDPNYGKLREPVVRLGNWIRAFHATPPSGRYQVDNTDSRLNQTPMNSSSVFNFFRPGFIPPNTQMASLGLTAPEMQIAQETSVAAYANTMQTIVQGFLGPSLDRATPNYNQEMALADRPDELVNRLNLLLAAGAMRQATFTQIVGAVSSVPLRTDTPANNAADRKNRVMLAVMLTMLSPDYIVQR